MRLSIIFSLLFILLLAIPCFSQTPDTLWTRTFGDDESQAGKCVIQTADGGFLIFGNASSDNFAYLLKVDNQGNEEWSQTYGTAEGDEGFESGFQTDDGNYICAGFTESYGAGNRDYWLVKTDQDGEVIWTQTYGGQSDDVCYSARPTSEGGIILGGYSNSQGTGNSDWWLVKTDADGNEEWNVSSEIFEVDICYDVKQTDDNGFVLTGGFLPPDDTYFDFFVTKTDSLGNVEWTFESGMENMIDIGNSVIQTHDGGYAAFGKNPTGFDNLYLVKLDEGGFEEWSNTYGGPDYVEYGYDIYQTGDNGFVLAASTASQGAGYLDAWIIKTDFYGNLQWDYVLGGTDSDYALSLCITDDLQYVFTGCTFSFGNGGLDIWLVCLESEHPPTNFSLVCPENGQMLHTSEINFSWLRSISYFPDRDLTYDLSVNMSFTDFDTTAVFTGLTDTSITLSVYDLTGLQNWEQMISGNWHVDAIAGPDTTECDTDFIFRVSSLQGNEELSYREIPETFEIHKIYPNPFNSSTTISISLPLRSDLHLGVYNIAGQEVASLADGKYDAGYQHFTFNSNGLASGVYFVRAETKVDNCLIKKIVYIR